MKTRKKVERLIHFREKKGKSMEVDVGSNCERPRILRRQFYRARKRDIIIR